MCNLHWAESHKLEGPEKTVTGSVRMQPCHISTQSHHKNRSAGLSKSPKSIYLSAQILFQFVWKASQANGNTAESATLTEGGRLVAI